MANCAVKRLTHPGHSRHWGIMFVRVLSLALVSLVLYGCSSNGSNSPGLETEFASGSGQAPAPTNCSTPNTGCPCTDDGLIVNCGEVVDRTNNYTSCSEGARTCKSGLWSDCTGNQIVKIAAVTSSSGLHALNVGQAQGCIANPCDPTCEQFTEGSANVADAGGQGLVVLDAGVSSLPGPAAAYARCTGVAVTPALQNVVVTSLSPVVTNPPNLPYTASLVPANCFGGTPAFAWGVSAYDRAVVDGNGNVTIVSPWAALFTVEAYVGGWSGSANINLTVNANETNLAPAGTAPTFSGVPTGPDAISFLYPYANTVFPVGLTSPTFQWDNGGVAASAVKVSLVYPPTGTNVFTWSTIVAESSPPSYQIPQYAWSALDEVARGNDVQITLQRLVGGNLRSVQTLPVHFSPSSLRGQIYYTRYPANGGNATQMHLVPAAGNAATFAWGSQNSGCTPCHSVSANGQVLLTSNWGTDTDLPSGYSVASINPDGSLNRICGSPDSEPGGVDSRGFSYGAITPDGKYSIQTANWWGNTTDTGSYNNNDPGNHSLSYSNKVWQLSTTPDVMSTDVSGSNAWGLGDAAIMMPSISPDGTKLIAIDGDRSNGASWRKGLHTWNFNEASETFSNPTSILNVTNTDQWLRWPSFESDSRSLLYQIAVDAEDQYNNSYGGGLPGGGCCGTYAIHGQLWSVDSQTPGSSAYLAQLNQGLGGADADWNYQPTMLPVSTGGYRWAAFTSVRQYGNTLNNFTHPAPPAGPGYNKQLWVSAIDDTTASGSDRSHPPFWLPGQEPDQANERAYWVLNQCKAAGNTDANVCTDNEDCCGGTTSPPGEVCQIDLPLNSVQTTTWFSGSLPAGATAQSDGGDSWNWVTSAPLPAPYHGLLEHPSSNAGYYEHQHYFYGAPASSQLGVPAGSSLFTYVYLDPTNPPSEVMLQWNDGSWEHRAYWGQDDIGIGSGNPVAHHYEGPLPPSGTWTRLDVATSDVGLQSIPLPPGVPPYHGSLAHQSISAGSYEHQHYFSGAPSSSQLPVLSGDTLFTYVYLDPTNPPSEVMLQWNDGSWEHRAYWGQDDIGWGSGNPVAHHYEGPLPATGGWVALQVAASDVGLGPSSLNGMAFALFGGLATWDYSGVISGGATTVWVDDSTPAGVTLASDGGDTWSWEGGASGGGRGTNCLNGMAFTLFGGLATWDYSGVVNGGVTTVWVDDSTPAGVTLASDGNDLWTWIGAYPTPYPDSPANRSSSSPGEHQHYFTGASAPLSVSSGDKIYAWVWLDPSNTPSELMLQFHDPSGSWEHRSYWGADAIGWGGSGSNQAHYAMGALPATGTWVKLEMVVDTMGLVGDSIDGMALTLNDGLAEFDQVGLEHVVPVLKHCQDVSALSCIATGGQCSTDANCCGYPDTRCISGVCTVPPDITYPPRTLTQTFAPTCPAGQMVAWHHLLWEDSTPADSSIVFAVRTNSTLAGLSGATEVPLVTSSTALGDSSTTTWNGVDVGAALTAAKIAAGPYLDLDITLVASSDGTQAPTLTSWQVQYDCVDSE
jgi:hypothetical protein